MVFSLFFHRQGGDGIRNGISFILYITVLSVFLACGIAFPQEQLWNDLSKKVLQIWQSLSGALSLEHALKPRR